MKLGQLFLKILSENHMKKEQNGHHDLENQVKVMVIELRLKFFQMHHHTKVGEARPIIFLDIEWNAFPEQSKWPP